MEKDCETAEALWQFYRKTDTGLVNYYLHCSKCESCPKKTREFSIEFMKNYKKISEEPFNPKINSFVNNQLI